jgi:hypothetical protein
MSLDREPGGRKNAGAAEWIGVEMSPIPGLVTGIDSLHRKNLSQIAIDQLGREPQSSSRFERGWPAT